MYVGISNTLLRNISASIQNDFSISIDPQAEVRRSNTDYAVIFQKPGDYILHFWDTRNNTTRLLFEKRIHASLLPNPIVKLNIENNIKDVLNVKDLLMLNRLVAAVDIGSQIINGRINGFRFTRISKNGEQHSIYNYSEVFHGPLQEMIGQLQKGDIVFFDNITTMLADGTTRTPSPILYKIID